VTATVAACAGAAEAGLEQPARERRKKSKQTTRATASATVGNGNQKTNPAC
jgi:hypothetical protein